MHNTISLAQLFKIKSRDLLWWKIWFSAEPIRFCAIVTLFITIAYYSFDGRSLVKKNSSMVSYFLHSIIFHSLCHFSFKVLYFLQSTTMGIVPVQIFLHTKDFYDKFKSNTWYVFFIQKIYCLQETTNTVANACTQITKL